MNASDVDLYFERYGWSAVRTGDGVWQTTVQGDRATLMIEVNLTADWLLFSMNMPGAGSRVRAHKLLAANVQMLLAKFAVDPQGKVLLRADMPTEGFTYSHFVDCLGALTHYADLYFDEWFQGT